MTPRIAVRLLLALVAAWMILQPVPDVDLWGHVLFGRDIVRDAALPVRDTYSFTSDLPWMNHEWLSEVLMYAAYAASPGSGLAALRLLLLAATFWAVWRALRSDGVAPEAALTLVAVAALLTYTRTQHVRPQLFSLAAFATLLLLLGSAGRGHPRALLAVPPLFALWANVHGGFIVGFLPLGLWTAHMAIDRALPARRRMLAAGVLAAAVLATLINPYGVGLWRFLSATVGPARGDIEEWLPVTRMGPGVLAFWAVTATLAAAGLWRHRGPRHLPSMALVAGLAVASFRVNRLDAFFVLATVMCLGRSLAAALAGQKAPHAPPPPLRPGPALTGAAVLALGAFLVLPLAPARVGCVSLRGAAWLPEPEAAAFAARNRLRGKIATFFNWGEYVIWHFAPDLQVSMDGRRETVYSTRHVRGHLELYAGSPAGLAYLRELGPDYVWMPSRLPVAGRLRAEGWMPIFEGERSTIFGRAPINEIAAAATTAAAQECFPGP